MVRLFYIIIYAYARVRARGDFRQKKGAGSVECISALKK